MSSSAVEIESVLEADLTPEQRAAATDPAADVLVIACAGSGKSRTLAFRIAWLISQGADPASIVAFTFTNNAAESIRRRVATALSSVGRPGTEVGKIRIGTIHSFCRQLLVEVDARYRQFDTINQNGLKLFLMSRYPQLAIQRFRNRNQRYFGRINELADAWTMLHDEVLDVNDIVGYDQQLGVVLQRLGELLDESNYIDYSLMIRLIVDRLAAADPQSLQVTENIRHLLVDEYQDINPLQERLIRLLRQTCDTLTVVGDDDQSIYGWRGADVQNTLNFCDRIPSASRHTLARNFRSTPLIVRSADRFVREELGANRLPKQPEADQGDGPDQVGAFGFPDRQAEAEWVAARIAALMGSPYHEAEGGVRGLTPGDFAILMRSTGSNEQDGTARSAAFTNALEQRDIPYILEAGGSVFSRPQVALLRDAMELLRERSPDRTAVLNFVNQQVRALFPRVREHAVTSLYARWGRHIHTDPNVERRRVYPQILLHELLDAFGIRDTELDDGAMADIGVLSRLLQDVETVYVSIDTDRRYGEILNFMGNIAESGYQSVTDMAVRQPDAVTVSTVHKAKGLEYPVVFIVDVESQRFPVRRSRYRGWLPGPLIQAATGPPRRAYGNNREQEARLFYTAVTRAERYLYITRASWLPNGRRETRQSPFTARLADSAVLRQPPPPDQLPANDLPQALPRRRIDETVLPTTFSEIRYYLRCPRDYQYRHVWGFSPPIPELFGFGQTVHAAVGKLHEQFADRAPTADEAEAVAREIFHVKHVPPSNDPDRRPGPYERAADASATIVREYAQGYSNDFEHRRQLEVRFEIPLHDSVLGGAIDLLLHLDDEGRIIGANVIDFKAMKGGPDPERNTDIDWAELTLQVQLYARAAEDVLDTNAHTGAVHLLKDGQRITVPVDQTSIEHAVQNVEWAAQRIIDADFPMRPHPKKCSDCDWKLLCPQIPEDFNTEERPPPLNLPGPKSQMVRAFNHHEQSNTR